MSLNKATFDYKAPSSLDKKEIEKKTKELRKQLVEIQA
ncbi:MAG: hypothetical protein ACJAZ3_001831 [Sphingobacteriales bacterium]|jgi:hypothetical protein